MHKGPLAHRLRFEGLGGGLHFVMAFKDKRSEAELVGLAAKAGVGLAPMGSFSLAVDALTSDALAADSPESTSFGDGAPRFVLRYDGSSESVAEDVAHALESAWS